MARLLAALIILYPLSFVRVDQRGAALLPMVIQLERTSPAFAAFEDVLNTYADENKNLQEPSSLVEIKLTAGKTFKPSREKAPSAPVLQVTLNTMRISKASLPMPTVVPEWKDGEDIPSLSERKKILVASVSKEELVQPSVSDRARELVQEELAQRTPGERAIVTHDGSEIIVRKPSVQAPARSPYVTAQKTNEITPSGQLVSGDVMLHGVPVGLGQSKSHWRVFRQWDGRVRETGSINIEQARFSIQVGQKRGNVVAELSDEWGRVIGRGQASLEDGGVPALNVNPVNTPTSVVAAYQPVGDSFGGETFAAAAVAPTPAAAPVDLDVSLYSKDSRFFVEANSRGHFPTVALGFLPELKRIPLYTMKAIKAFYEIVRSFYRPLDITNQALLWGSVTREGKPLAGATVDVASAQGRVVYFNEIGIPLADLQQTTGFGQFAVANVDEGIQSVRVTYQGVSYPARVIPSAAGKLTQVDLQVPSRFVNQFFRFFSLSKTEADPQTETVPATLRWVGTDSSYDFPQGGKSVAVPVLEDGLLTEWDAGAGYELMRTQLPQLTQEMDVALPVASHQWVEELIASAGKTLDRRLGWALGFSKDTDAAVRLKNVEENFYDVIYFDRDFHLWNGPTVPAGGGFLVFNLPLGYQTLEMTASQSSLSHAESFVSEPYFLYLVNGQSFIQPAGQKNP